VPFEVIPAIDLRGGRCVRLYRGEYDRETVYGDDPVAMALHWQDLGATRIHVVDLDGARTGEQANAEAVRTIVRALRVPVQLGGGVRDLATVERWLDAGVDCVFLGTAAVEQPRLVQDACQRFPGRVGAGADVKDGHIATRGWESSSGETAEEFIRRVLDAGVACVSYTDVARDGTLEGPDLEGVRQLLGRFPERSARFLLAGGVGSLEDVLSLSRVPGLDGVIVGRALYDNRLDLGEALRALKA
jgi:phosphoribosylformimino-5-aminoimidazole carboxamide ribotide isomerase